MATKFSPFRKWSSAPTLVLLAVLGIFILVPMAFILLSSFSTETPRPGNIGFKNLTLDNFGVIASDYALAALRNSLFVGAVACLASLLIGGALAFLCARTDVPGRRAIYFFGLMPLFLPSYIGALAWVILASPHAGLINLIFRDFGLSFGIDIYNIGGLAFVLAIYNAPYAFLFINGALSLMNPDLEDAASVHGGSLGSILTKVTFPLLLPAVLGSGILIFTLSVENFAVPAVIGTPGRIDTLPTIIYRLMNTFPARGNEAAAVAILLTAFVILVTVAQRFIIGRRNFTTVTGKGVKPRVIPLGMWRWPAFILAAIYFLLAVVFPTAALLIVALSKSQFITSFTDFLRPDAFSIGSFVNLFQSPLFQNATWNSVLVSVLAALFGTALCFVLAYTVYRTRSRGKAALEYVAMLPLAVPAIVFGLGLLWTWLVMPVPVYGTLIVMVIAFIAYQIPQGYRGISSVILQTHSDLEDSAVMAGAHRSQAIRYVTLPLMKVGLASTFLLLLLLSMRELSIPLFLYTSDTRILSIMIFDDLENGLMKRAASISVVYCVLIAVFASITLRIGGVSFRSGS